MPSRPNLLVVEDEPISAQYLVDALAGLADCVTCEAMDQALQLARSRRFGLAIVDCELSDGPSLSKLPELISLLESPARVSVTSAEWDEEKRLAYLSQGAADCLAKPISANELRARVQLLLGAAPATSIWNDRQALTRLGNNPIQLQALRSMLLQELPGQLDRLRSARDQGLTSTIQTELHRLRAACGFCGAEALGAAIERWAKHPSPAHFESTLEAAEQLIRQSTSPI